MTISDSAILYLRQSRDTTREEHAVTRQRSACRKLAKARGWRVVAEHVDNDVSAAGGKKKRPGFEAVLSAIEAEQASVIVATELTRLTRNARDTLRLLEIGQQHGTVLSFVRDAEMDLGTSGGRMMASIVAAVARQEIERKSERQIAANTQAAAAGRWVGGRRPFGYEADGVTIRVPEAAALRRAFDDVLAGVPLARIAANLNAAGFPTPQRTRTGGISLWTAQTVRPMLLNPRYAGLRARSIRPDHGRPTWEIIGKAQWDGIVAEETWRAVMAVLTDMGRTNPSGSARALLTGLALCGVCGATVHGGRTRYGARTYRCSEALGHISRAADPVDEYVAAVVVARLSRPDARALLESDRPDTAPMRTEAMALRARLDAIAVEFADGELTASQLRTATTRIRDRLTAIEAELADAGRVNVLGPVVHAEDVRAAWEELETDRQRAVLEALMVVRLLPPGRGTRTFRPETVVIDGRQS